MANLTLDNYISPRDREEGWRAFSVFCSLSLDILQTGVSYRILRGRDRKIRRNVEMCPSEYNILCESEVHFTLCKVTGDSRLLPHMLSKTKWAPEMWDIQIFQVPKKDSCRPVVSVYTRHCIYLILDIKKLSRWDPGQIQANMLCFTSMVSTGELRFPFWRLLNTFEKYKIMCVWRAEMAQGCGGTASICLCFPSVFSHFFAVSSFPIQKQLQAKMESHFGMAVFLPCLVILRLLHHNIVRKKTFIFGFFKGNGGFWNELRNFAATTSATTSVPCFLTENLEEKSPVWPMGFFFLNPTLYFRAFNY